MKFILKLTLLLFILASCKKEKDSSDTSDNTKLLEKFDASFVKEWYYSVFKKSNEWKGSGGKQLPYWPKGIYKKVGSLEIVEFPLMKKSKDISIPADGLEDYNKVRIAEASLQRIAFIRDKKGNIYVREIDYIPEWSYLQQNKFDISNPENMDVKANFRGRKIVKDWGNKTLVLLRIHNGKVTGRGIPKSNTLNRTETCSTIRYCIWQQDCELEFVGDVVSLDCSEWYNTHECWDETVCTGGGDDCENFGINCEEPGEGDGPTPIPLVIIDTVINEITDPCMQNAFAEITADNLKNQISRMYQETFVGNNNVYNLLIGTVSFIPTNPLGAAGSHADDQNPNTWVIDLSSAFQGEFTQEFWATIILHELVHGFIVKNDLDFSTNVSLGASHQEMLDKWIVQIQEALVETFGMGSTDALALSLTGFDDILKDKVSQQFKDDMKDWMEDKYSVNLNTMAGIANDYKNQTKGTPCD